MKAVAYKGPAHERHLSNADLSKWNMQQEGPDDQVHIFKAGVETHLPDKFADFLVQTGEFEPRELPESEVASIDDASPNQAATETVPEGRARRAGNSE